MIIGPKIQVLVGLIASGKSTWASKVALDGAVIVNDDAIVTAIHGGNYLLYRKELKPLYKSTENHIVFFAIALGKRVIIDRGNNVSVRSRKRWIGLANSLDVPCEAIVFPKEDLKIHAQRRMKENSRGYSLREWLEALERWDKQYQEPTTEEGFEVIQHVTFQSDKQV